MVPNSNGGLYCPTKTSKSPSKSTSPHVNARGPKKFFNAPEASRGGDGNFPPVDPFNKNRPSNSRYKKSVTPSPSKSENNPFKIWRRGVEQNFSILYWS